MSTPVNKLVSRKSGSSTSLTAPRLRLGLSRRKPTPTTQSLTSLFTNTPENKVGLNAEETSKSPLMDSSRQQNSTPLGKLIGRNNDDSISSTGPRMRVGLSKVRRVISTSLIDSPQSSQQNQPESSTHLRQIRSSFINPGEVKTCCKESDIMCNIYESEKLNSISQTSQIKRESTRTSTSEILNKLEKRTQPRKRKLHITEDEPTKKINSQLIVKIIRYDLNLIPGNSFNQSVPIISDVIMTKAVDETPGFESNELSEQDAGELFDCQTKLHTTFSANYESIPKLAHFATQQYAPDFENPPDLDLEDFVLPSTSTHRTENLKRQKLSVPLKAAKNPDQRRLIKTTSKFSFPSTDTIDSDDDCFTSSPESDKRQKENLLKMVEEMEKKVKAKQDLLQQLNQAQTYKKLHNVEELKTTTDQWKVACKLALKNLLVQIQKTETASMDELVKRLNLSDVIDINE